MSDPLSPRNSFENPQRIPPEKLRWVCDAEWLAHFETTEELEPIPGVIGQDDAIESLRFGLEIHAPGQNIFVRGLTGTGRLTLLKRLLREVRLACPLAPDRCYVHDFSKPDCPKQLILPRGTAQSFARAVTGLIDFIGDELLAALSSEALRDRRNSLSDRSQREREALLAPFEEELGKKNLALVSISDGPSTQMAIVPLVDGRPTAPDAYEQLVAKGEVSADVAKKTMEQIGKEVRSFEKLAAKLAELQQQHREDVHGLFEAEARKVLSGYVHSIEKKFPQDAAIAFLNSVVQDVVNHRLPELSQGQDTAFTRLYEVNVVSDHADNEDCPVIVESHPTLENLFGGIEREFSSSGAFRSDHRGVRVGSVVRADGGYLLIEARDLLGEPGAWKALTRFLRTGKAEVATNPRETAGLGPNLKPEAPEVNVKVVLIGDPQLYYLLDAQDPEFPHLFKVLADFEPSLPRTPETVASYAGVIARIGREEDLLPFSGDAVAALAEHGARISGRNDRLTTRFGRLADIAREASFIANKRPSKVVRRVDVEDSVISNKKRADLPARRFRRSVSEGTIKIMTTGREIGQLNGLAVVHAGPLTYGFPSRITATIGPGTAGTINIEREAQLSGSIHTKGFYILGGLLRTLLRTDHPLAFSASVAFEQSYGGIDGDSASGAEMCCLLSALTEIPLRQDRAMTGAIDQLGNIQPIGAANEKIEGFFDVCEELGLTGEQGVIIPRANVRDLMLRPTVVDACCEKQFHVFAVDTIGEAMEIFTDLPAGSRGADGHYPDGSVFSCAVERAREFWELMKGKVENHQG